MQVEKSVEAMMLYLATLRAGYVFLPLNTAYQSAEIEYFIGNAEPAVVVCSAQEFRLGRQDRLQGRHAACVHAQRRPHAARCSNAPRITATSTTIAREAAKTTWPRSSTPAAPPAAARARCSRMATCCPTREVLKDYWGWRAGDVLIHALADLPRARLVRRASTARCSMAAR